MRGLLSSVWSERSQGTACMDAWVAFFCVVGEEPRNRLYGCVGCFLLCGRRGAKEPLELPQGC